MKKVITVVVILISCVLSTFAQRTTEVVGNRKYEFVAEVKTYYLDSNGSLGNTYGTLPLFEMYHLAYYTDNLGVRHDTWEFRGYYLKDKNGSYYKVNENATISHYNQPHPHSCNLANAEVSFIYDF